MICPHCNRHQMYKGENGKWRCPYCHDRVKDTTPKSDTPKMDRDTLGALQDIVALAVSDQQNYLQDGSTSQDYGDEWPAIARARAAAFRKVSELFRAQGLYATVTGLQNLADGLEASAREFRNPDFGN